MALVNNFMKIEKYIEQLRWAIHECCLYKWKNHFHEMNGDVGMAGQKNKETRK